jgi:hypothetical protein
MAIATLADLLAAREQRLAFAKLQTSNGGFPVQLWRTFGKPENGTDPVSGVAGQVLTIADNGTFDMVNPSSGLTYLARVSIASGVAGAIVICDRLWHNSGLSPTVLTAQTVNSVALPSRCPVRSDPTGQTFDALGNGVEAWFQVMGTAMGAGTVAPTISYTDDQGNAGNVVTLNNWSSAMIANRTERFELLAGDRGVRSIQTYQQTATQTSGVFSLVLRRRIATLWIPAVNQPFTFDWNMLGMPVIPNSAHLEFLWLPLTPSVQAVHGEIVLAQG